MALLYWTIHHTREVYVTSWCHPQSPVSSIKGTYGQCQGHNANHSDITQKNTRYTYPIKCKTKTCKVTVVSNMPSIIKSKGTKPCKPHVKNSGLCMYRHKRNLEHKFTGIDSFAWLDGGENNSYTMRKYGCIDWSLTHMEYCTLNMTNHRSI